MVYSIDDVAEAAGTYEAGTEASKQNYNDHDHR